jgi:2-ketocyclohexanecarboxyl-CoA hydrolase
VASAKLNDHARDATVTDILHEVRSGVLWLTLNRPERRNAYDLDMAVDLTRLVEGASAYESVVITGSGGSFCAGGALGQLDQADPAHLRELFTASWRLVDAIRACPRPVIAAVNGAAAGGGNELVVACDLAVAARSATFGQTGPRVGSAPVLGATNVMAVQIGEKRAKELSFLCERYSADEALAMGLVNKVVEDSELETAVRAMTDRVHLMSPRYLEIAKVSSNVWWNASRDSMAAGIGMLVQAIGSEDMREGARAFLEKRPPRFRPDADGGAR